MVTSTKHHCLNSGNMTKTDGVQICLYFVTVLWVSWRSCDTKRGLVGANVFYSGLPLLIPNHSFSTCGGLEAVTSTTIFLMRWINCLKRAGMLHPENSFGLSSSALLKQKLYVDLIAIILSWIIVVWSQFNYLKFESCSFWLL